MIRLPRSTTVHCALCGSLLLSSCTNTLVGARPVNETGKGTIGLYARIVRRDSALYEVDVPKRPVAVVTRVIAGGPADRAGIKQGDWIMRVGAHRAVSAEEVIALIRATRPGAVIELHVRRYGESKTFQVTVEEMR